MKTARVVIDAATLLCPHCQEALTDPGTGSEMMTEPTMPPTVQCEGCGERIRIPAVWVTPGSNPFYPYMLR